MNSKKIPLKNFPELVRGMLEDSGYMFSDEYEVGIKGEKGGGGREGGERGREG